MILLCIALIIGFYMAWNIGANDVANAMGTSIGSRALTFKQAVFLAAIFECLGAILVGSHVTNTVRKGIVDPNFFVSSPELLVYGMLSALVAAALWLHLASYFGQPVSTTHSIIGAVFGFGLISGGAVQWTKMSGIVASWFISPLASGVIAFFMFRFIVNAILIAKRPSRAAARYAPFLVMLVAFILTLSLIYKGLKNIHLALPFNRAILLAAIVSMIFGLIARWAISRINHENQPKGLEQELISVERIFRYLQVVTACYVAFAHGANDVANAVGPLAAIYAVSLTGEVAMEIDVPIWMLILGGFGIVAGLTMYGRRVIETVGSKITEMTPSRGFSAEFAGATAVLVCSKMGLPISTTHSLVGAVIGVGFARGIGALNAKVVRSIFTSWIATVPITAIIAMGIFLFIRWLLA